MNKLFNKKILAIILGGIILSIFSILTYLKDEKNNNDKLSFIETTEKITTFKEKNYIDIKGQVKNPGVYEFKENDRVIDAIELAGGLKKNANTSNINLSKKLESEMVIYVYSNSEIKNKENKLNCDAICKTEVIEINNCIENTINNSNLININTATLEELETLSGIGESKAKTIIEYRDTNGNFKSIEELKNISGIGESLFEKIKDKITV